MAQYNLAQMYRNGNGVDKDNKKAFELFKESSKECLNGKFMLGYCYNMEIGISVDKKKAAELYQQSADQGHKVAKNNLAILYKRGEGVNKDCDKASELFKELYLEGYSNIYGTVLNCCDIDNNEKVQVKGLLDNKVVSLINTLVSDLSDENQVEICQAAAKFGQKLIKFDSAEIVENYKTCEGIIKNIKNVFYRSADEIKKLKINTILKIKFFYFVYKIFQSIKYLAVYRKVRDHQIRCTWSFTTLLEIVYILFAPIDWCERFSLEFIYILIL